MKPKDLLIQFITQKNKNTIQTAHGAEYYAKLFFEQILPQIAQISNQDRYGYHGLTHTTQVAMFGLDIAYTINQEPLPVLLAAGLHDCARTNDEWCTEHGPHAVPIAREFLATHYPHISVADTNKILYAIENHTTGRYAPDGVSACLWDGDRIRLSWEWGYKPKFFNTARGKQIASMSQTEQKKYMIKQDNFLINNKIRTAKEIQDDRDFDKIIEHTRFKTR
ncbi:MAG: hypothetical protein J6R52_01215 [Alphaproteobacteria bacterium]|nr:hypothetical protein [Alphaproteobacteria bacterium]